jgi:hypothetical protein
LLPACIGQKESWSRDVGQKKESFVISGKQMLSISYLFLEDLGRYSVAFYARKGERFLKRGRS